jgi:hypothetical protein
MGEEFPFAPSLNKLYQNNEIAYNLRFTSLIDSYLMIITTRSLY